MKEQLEQLIKDLEASKLKTVHGNDHAGQCAEIGRIGGLNTAIHQVQLLLLKID